LIANRFRESYRSRAGHPLVLAHRGDSYRGPENTLEAASLGHEAGADGWELDVRLTRDGVPVVLHDESLARTTDVALAFAGDPRAARGFLVGDFDWDEVRSLDAGSWFLDPDGGPRSAAGFGSLDRVDRAARDHFRSGHVRVPGLVEALEWTARLDWIVNVEIKPVGDGGGPSPIAATLGAIRATATEDRVAVSSFDLAVVAEVGRLEPGVAIGALIDGTPGRPVIEFLFELGGDALHISVEGFDRLRDGASSPRLGDHRPTAPVLVYTVNVVASPGLADRLAVAGVSGLFTDDPTSLRARDNFNRSAKHTRSH